MGMRLRQFHHNEGPYTREGLSHSVDYDWTPRQPERPAVNFNPDQVTRLQIAVKITEDLEIFLVSSLAPRRNGYDVKSPIMPATAIRSNYTGLGLHQRITN